MEETVDFTTAALGGKRSITVNGQGIQLSIPAGTLDGARLAVRGKGAPGASGGTAGDLIVTVRVAPSSPSQRMAALLRRSVAMWRSRQLSVTLSFAPENHSTNGKRAGASPPFCWLVVVHVCRSESSAVSRRQNVSGSSRLSR